MKTAPRTRWHEHRSVKVALTVFLVEVFHFQLHLFAGVWALSRRQPGVQFRYNRSIYPSVARVTVSDPYQMRIRAAVVESSQMTQLWEDESFDVAAATGAAILSVKVANGGQQARFG